MRQIGLLYLHVSTSGLIIGTDSCQSAGTYASLRATLQYSRAYPY